MYRDVDFMEVQKKCMTNEKNMSVLTHNSHILQARIQKI